MAFDERKVNRNERLWLLPAGFAETCGGYAAREVLGPGGRRPPRGPLHDGDLTARELVDLMHHTAVPHEPPGPTRYFIEGYGAINDTSQALAMRVLRGEAAEPARPQEDADDAQVTAAHRAQTTTSCVY